MPAEVDIFAIKTRIADILKGVATIYDQSDESKFMEIEAGFPPGGVSNLPTYAFVTANQNYENLISETISAAAGKKSLRHVFRLDVVMVAKSADARAAEEKLDDLVKIVKETLEGDARFVGTGSALVDDSVPEKIQYGRINLHGTTKLEAVMTLKIDRTTN